MSISKSIFESEPIWEGVAFGKLVSKSNSRRIVFRGRTPRSIKSEDALRFFENFQKQIPRLKNLIEDDVAIELIVYYPSRRSDLDDTLLCDALQGIIIKNDRQIREKHLIAHIDRDLPRVQVRIWKL